MEERDKHANVGRGKVEGPCHLICRSAVAGPLQIDGAYKYGKVQRVNLIWRFFMDQDRKWKWQRLSFSHAVVEESAAGYADYDGCVADATSRGYTVLPPLSTRPAATPHVRRR